MHRRRRYLVYPPNYKPGDGYEVTHSRRQAWRAGIRMGDGASVYIEEHMYHSPHKRDYSFRIMRLWDIEEIKS